MFKARYDNERKLLQIFECIQFKQDDCVARFEMCEFSEVPTLIKIFKRNNELTVGITLEATNL